MNSQPTPPSDLPLRFDSLDIDQAVVTPGGEAIVVRTDDKLLAFANRCPHQNLPLTGAHVADGVLICPHHFWRFRLPEGCATAESGEAPCLSTLHVAVNNGLVEVELTEPSTTSASTLRDELLARAATWNRDDPPDPNHPGLSHG